MKTLLTLLVLATKPLWTMVATVLTVGFYLCGWWTVLILAIVYLVAVNAEWI
jgi:hypothetical protein